MIRCVACDLDGTLLDGQGYLSERSRQAIIALQEAGICFLPASGRAIASAKGVFQDVSIEDYVLLNGSLILSKDEIIYENKLSEEKLRTLYDLIRSYDIECVFFTNIGVVSTNQEITRANFVASLIRGGMKEEDAYGMLNQEGFAAYADIVKDIDELFDKGYSVYKMEFYAHDESEYQTIQKLLKQDQTILTSGWTSLNFEITNHDAGKANALCHYLKLHDIKEEELVVMGDSMNDYDMIKRFPHSIAMRNAAVQLKACAAYVNPYTNEEDGAAYVLETILARMKGDCL